MEASLLFIVESVPDLLLLEQEISDAFTQDGFSPVPDVIITHAETIAEGEQLLFERSPTLLVVESVMNGSLEFVRSLKNDEMFRFLPIVVISPAGHPELNEEFFLAGTDCLLEGRVSEKSLFRAVRPLIRNKLLMDDMQGKLISLQDEHIRNFILVDLVRRYIPRTVWDMAFRFAGEQTIRLPEKEEEVTIAYGDIVGFTTISQYLKPKDVISMLNEAYDIVTRIIYEYEGDIDKFIGDAFLAVFTDPKSAVLSALRIQYDMEKLNEERRNHNLPPLLFRIGVHTGTVIRGNVGGELRNDNTLIGDTVNTSARVESITPPGEILVSEQTCRRAGINVSQIYRVEEKVKGKDDILILYNLFRFSCDNGRKIDIL